MLIVLANMREQCSAKGHLVKLILQAGPLCQRENCSSLNAPFSIGWHVVAVFRLLDKNCVLVFLLNVTIKLFTRVVVLVLVWLQLILICALAHCYTTIMLLSC